GLVLAPAHAQDAAPTARLRIIHAAQGAPNVDVYLNGLQVAQDAPFGAATPHYTVSAGSHVVDIRPADADPSSAPVLSTSVDLLSDLAFSLVVQNGDALESALYEDILDPLTPGTARLTAVHAVPVGPAVDIARGSEDPLLGLLANITYGQQAGTIDLPAGVYDLRVVESGDGLSSALASQEDANLIASLNYTLVVAPDDPAQIIRLQTATNPGPDDMFVRLVHAAEDAPNVDIYINNALIAAGVPYTGATPHIALPEGEAELALREAGTPPNSEPIFDETILLEGPAATVGIFAEDDALAVQSFADPVGQVVPEQALVQRQNFGGDDLSIEIDGEALADEPFAFEPGIYELSGDAEETAQLFGGTLYSVLAFADEVIVLDTALAVTPNSVPFEQPEEAALGDAAPPAGTTDTGAETPAEEPAPTAVEGDDFTGGDPNAQPGETPVAQAPVATATAPAAPQPTAPQVATPTATQPAAAQQPPPQQPPAVAQPNAVPTRPGIFPPVDVIFGVVTLNQGVNLQCREYPTTQARSLGLIPNGTELIVQGLFAPRDTTGDIGRTDAILIEGIPDFTGLLGEENTIMDIPQTTIDTVEREDIWLNIDWPLEDGTLFGCWVNALYIQINFDNERIDETLEYLQLADNRNIDLTPYNVPGGPRDPDVTVNPAQVSQPTPRAAEGILATVNVNRGVNLQLRRTPGVDGESLALVPGGAQLRIIEQTSVPVTGDVGEPTVPEWLFAEFQQADGTRVRGWLSAEFVILTLEGRLVTLEQVPVAQDITRGGLVTEDDVILPEGGGAAPPPPAQTSGVQGTLLTDAGTNLNVRAEPNESALVRVSIPNTTPLQVLGRNSAGDWVQISATTGTGPVTGWIRTQFVQLTFNGQPYDVTQLDVTSGE
ncbi:MAG: DUF4397 domain-containing protein, partial [Anaerolineales bacterium]